ncbi:MAG: GNAT family N-acetyltransferase [Prolixibacteraceae bacterium]|nr:GNAT family N-acetyltransferase [Prolixibacteraceae bacterium]
MWMAEIIFNTIDRDREYLKKWLPFVEHINKISDAELFVKSLVNQPSLKKDEMFSIWYKDEFAGLVGFKDTDWVNRKTELGYWLAEKMQGKGIVTLCIEKLLRFAFQKLKLNRVQIKVALGNKKSAAIPRQLGFHFEGIEREGELHTDYFADLEVFSMAKSEWSK